MKIVIATGLYYPDIGGPATYVKMLEEHLPAYGAELTVVPFSKVKQYPKIIKHLKYMQLLWRASRDNDIVFALDPVSVGLPAMLVAKLRRKKFVLRVPGDFAWEQAQLRFGVTDTFHTFIEQRYSYNWRVSLLNAIESSVARRAQLVIVPSNYMQAAIPKWGVAPSKVKRIYSALEPIRPAPKSPPPMSAPVLVSSGRLVPNKGFVGLIEAFAVFKVQHSAATLVIIGDGPQRPELTALIERLKLTDSVILTGKLNRDVLASYIQAADVYVLNTAHEGLSHQLLEVMSLHTPIATTPAGGNAELIEAGTTGVLFPYNDQPAMVAALHHIVTDPVLREQVVRGATKKLAQFTADQSVNETFQVLTAVHKTARS
jgi:glycosyltransferase involved in cell wall biosynthesis